MKKQASGERYEHILGMISDCFTVVDENGSVAFASIGLDAIEKLRQDGVSSSPSANSKWKITTFDGRPIKKSELPLAKVIDTGKAVYGFNLAVERPGNSRLFLSVDAMPICDKDGNITNIVLSLRDITEHEQVKEALRASEKRLRDITSALGEGLFVLGKDGTLTFMNPEAEKLLGWTEKELIGKKMHDIIHCRKANGTVLPAYECPVLKVIRSGKTYRTHDDIFIRKDGSALPVAYITTPLIENGKLVGSVTSFHDITRRKLYERTIKESEERYRQLIETANEGVWVLGPDNKTVFVNNRMAEMLGYTADEMIGMSSFAFMDEEVQAVSKNRLRRRRQGIKEQFDFRFRRKDGTSLWVIMSASPLFDRDGNYIGSLGMVTDITNRKRIERALLESEERYRALFEDAADAILIMEAEGEDIGRIIAANQAAADMHGYTIEELLKLNIKDLDAPDEAAKVPERMKRILSGEKIKLEVMHRKKDGTEFPVEAHVHLLDIAGRRYIQAIDRDMTDSRNAKRLSDALNEINAAINSTLDVDEIMQKAIAESARALGADNASIAIKEGDEWFTRYKYGAGGVSANTRLTGDETKYIDIVIQTKETVVISDAYNDARVDPELMKRYGVRSIIVTPLAFKSEVIGILKLTFFSRTTFSDAQIDFINKLAASVSLALENARLYELEHRIARTLQENLIRPVPSLPALDVEVVYKPALGGEIVGGDFYDIFELDDQSIAMVIGDVSGKGIEAAGLTETIRSTIRTLAYIDPSPSFVLNRANQTLMRQLSNENFATAAFLTLDVATKDVRIASAGHPLPVLCGNDGCSLLNITQGFPLGSFNCSYVEYCLRLKKGQGLLLYTDGLVEARRGAELFGEERILVTIADMKVKDPCKAVHVLLKSANDFAQGKLVDDIALVAVRFSPSLYD
ncbi:MAG: PAS domain S-box protein [Firmicutes bacterium]|nr:PAS domain S-box protein [Bacillota bacterium]